MAAAELPVAEQARPLDLIAYQESAVVSRTLLKRPTGTVTMFAFDEGQGLSEHAAPFGSDCQQTSVARPMRWCDSGDTDATRTRPSLVSGGARFSSATASGSVV